ncbi:GFA family protein [Varunaivibrio sulfuroxidans]|uniref:CENP-V/GFA domain-containing protein n=1 Tax=Varunaivibrio sulfuroxidans TaxID=1773489 RepID=A0A4R3JFK9_9PROT|nr:GFA family protein [Varunaivibrio sulfuroxidans]TCS64929.1 hypothetical protein EDD55_101260 [Varunaivibrio sulfuroxidans]WES29779.1 GFA family protein [Varunaivibrio sulfuroxidans]
MESEHALDGGCFCKAVRLHITGPAMFAGHCHCTDCQKFSGGGHASAIIFATNDVHVSGETASFRYAADSGNHLTRHFCPVCGVHLYHINDAHPQMTTIPAGALDEPALFRPAFSIYGASAQAWDAPDDTLPSFAHMPPRGAIDDA